MNDFRGSRAPLAPRLPAWARALGLCVCLAVACRDAEVPHCDSPEAITVHVHPAKHLNPDRAGLPRSVVVRLYQLGDSRPFESSSFDRLWAGGADGLPSPQQLIALPGRSQAHSLQRDPQARYLAVAANFREREGESHWRALVRLPEQKACGRWLSERDAPIELSLADYALSLR